MKSRSSKLVFALPLLCGLAQIPVPAQTDKVDEYIQGEMKPRRIPGLALVAIKNGEVAKIKGYGFANLEHDVPVTPDTVFELASVTEQFTAAATMLLVEEGTIKLDDPIIKYLPRSPQKWNAITIRHLLTHTAGLPEHTTLPEMVNYTTAEEFTSATELPMSFSPGEDHEYSNVGYFLLGMIIEQVSCQRYRLFLAQRFLKPLAMTSTSVLDQWTIVKNRAAGYAIWNGELVNIRRIWQEELASDWGVISTVKDLATWDTALASGKVVKESSLAEMWAPAKLKNGRSYPSGFGWEIHKAGERRIITHRAQEELLSRIFASWNQLDRWLRQLDELRAAYNGQHAIEASSSIRTTDASRSRVERRYRCHCDDR
jgi:CubicO group peptidase (beta-lactamase class C family)